MRVAHFDCFSGISGDMTLGALIDAGVDDGAIRAAIDSLGLPVRMVVEKVHKGGFAATAVRMQAAAENQHRHLPQIEEIVRRGRLTERQRDLALRIFRRLGEAEAAVHGMPLDKVHFHEVGALDSIADIVGAAVGLDLIGAEEFTSRSVPPGGGTVQCAHGLMPVPAPGTAALLKGVPLAFTPIQAELTTPTGAAILTTVVTRWTEQPVMTLERIGCGAGQRDFAEQPNLLRLFVGTVPALLSSDQVWVLETNLDDLPGEVVGYCYDPLLAAGALDVYATPVLMKKNRPGVVLTILCTEAAIAAVEDVLFRETTTLGIRRHLAARHKLKRRPWIVRTQWGPVQGKLSWADGRPPAFSPEYEDCARLAREQRVPLRDVYAHARAAYHEGIPGSS